MWYYWAGGIATVLGGGYLLARRGAAVQSSQSDNSNQDNGAAGYAAPLFLPTGGGTVSPPTNDLPLGGEAWAPVKVPLADNPDVAIARINADVQLAAIDAASKLSDMGSTIVAPSSPPNSIETRGEWRGNSIAAATEYGREMLAKTPAIGAAAVQQDIYSAAKAKGYSASEVALAYSSASGSTVTPEQVNGWLKERGLSL